jgi:hypothetical protein
MYGMIGSAAAPIAAIVFHKCCIFFMIAAGAHLKLPNELHNGLAALLWTGLQQ